eukprot:scaffold83121_cov72-Phaeocystis_antarctica.AAC.4
MIYHPFPRRCLLAPYSLAPALECSTRTCRSPAAPADKQPPPRASLRLGVCMGGAWTSVCDATEEVQPAHAAYRGSAHLAGTRLR